MSDETRAKALVDAWCSASGPRTNPQQRENLARRIAALCGDVRREALDQAAARLELFEMAYAASVIRNLAAGEGEQG